MKKIIITALLFGMALAGMAQPQMKRKAVKWIASDDHVCMNAEWSPDGKKIAFTSDNNKGVFVCNAKGRQVERITDDANVGFRFSWSADGKSILSKSLVVTGNKRYQEVVMYDAGSKKKKVLLGKAQDIKSIPRWVDGGASVAVLVDNDLVKVPTGKAKLKGAAEDQIALLQGNIVVGAEDVVLADPKFQGRYVFNHVQSPDGSKVVFQVNGLGLYVIDADGSHLKHLGYGEQAAWTPDGKYVLVTNVKDDGVILTSGEIVAIDVNNKQSFQLLTDPDIIALNPSLSPDGNMVLIDNVKDGAIYMFEIEP